MFGIKAARPDDAGTRDLFVRIGVFLAEHRLSPEPGHYAFAYHVLSDAGGPLAQAVDAITEHGVRLSREDIEGLGGEVCAGAPLEMPEPGGDPAAEALVAQTWRHVAGLTDMMRDMQDETRGFGRDLAASAEALSHSGDLPGTADLARLTAAMIERVHAAEGRLAVATQEASDLREKLAEAQGSARRDPLTELPNRRAFEEAFAASDAAVPRAIAICDIDHFKQVNDGFGHAVGDRVLKAIGQALAARCAGNLVARHGGEEFVVLFAAAGAAAALATLDAARIAIAGRRFRLRECDTPVGAITFSAGLTAVMPGEPLDVALARADRALYRAKADGRNRVQIADDTPENGAIC